MMVVLIGLLLIAIPTAEMLQTITKDLVKLNSFLKITWFNKDDLIISRGIH